MSTTYYICKYTPVELLEAFGGECAILNHMPDNFELSDQVAHPNICGFGKSLLEACMEGKVKELVLVNCCDTIRSVSPKPTALTKGPASTPRVSAKLFARANVQARPTSACSARASATSFSS